MSQTITQFVFFKVKPSVTPETPANEEGENLLKVMRTTKTYSGHQRSAWGRTAEDEHTIVWVVEWSDARGSIQPSQLQPFLDPSRPLPTTLYVTLQPPVSSTDTLTKNPVTELCALAFPSNLSVPRLRELNLELIEFRTALVEQLPQEAGPRSWTMGHVDRPSPLQHAESPTGQAIVHLLAVGWESVDAHMKAKQTEQFGRSIAPIREKMLPPIPGLEMKHVSFRKVE